MRVRACHVNDQHAFDLLEGQVPVLVSSVITAICQLSAQRLEADQKNRGKYGGHMMRLIEKRKDRRWGKTSSFKYESHQKASATPR